MALCITAPAWAAVSPDLDALIGKPADIASSAYQYRSDRSAAQNAPESWLALMRYDRQPLNQKAATNTPAIQGVLRALLWEEIRPIQRVELVWTSNGLPKPSAEDILLTTLDRQGSASSWWNNLAPVPKPLKPEVSADGSVYSFPLRADTCGLVIALKAPQQAKSFAVPEVRVFTTDAWKRCDIEIEWGFDPKTDKKNYSGRVEVYDGLVTGLQPLPSDSSARITSTNTWRVSGPANGRRGIKASLLYVGTSKWRKVQPFTSQPDDVARTIVTLWTEAGNFSFLAADLENGPILAPEYGFFVRRASAVSSPANTKVPVDLRTPAIPLTEKMQSIAGNIALRGWGSDQTPWFGGNPSEQPQNAQGIALPARSVAMHPGAELNVVAAWRSPAKANVRIQASLTHAQSGGNGIEWRIDKETRTQRVTLAQGTTEGTQGRTISTDANDKALAQVSVEQGDILSIVIGPRGQHQCDTTIIDFAITESKDGKDGRIWNLRNDVAASVHSSNPHADSLGNESIWHFYAEQPSTPAVIPSDPPISLVSNATSAREFIRELEHRKLPTIRQQIRSHPEQTWEEAVAAMRGTNLPPHPTPPAGFEPRMQVRVPSDRLTAQWNLGNWHLLRHAEKHPATGRLWFNDYPYGILGAETYMVLAALDLMGSHRAAGDGFEQWVSLPMDSKTSDHPGHHEWALPDRPNGLFSEGHGCLTHAIGPPGAGGHMDGVHAFGPGSIGWALVEHYRLTGDTNWFKTSANRLKANAEWMLRQRRVVQEMVPGGERLWCKGLQPALQVTPDSGGLWMQFYECEAYYWVFVKHFADALVSIDPVEGARLQKEAEAYRRDLLATVERSIALSPVVPIRDGTFHSVVPFACYVRGLSTGAWGWLRDGSGSHVGPLYWETVQSAAALVSPAGLLSPADARIQGYLDVLEDRLLLENPYVGEHRDWFAAGWQYQGGLERTANMHLAADDVPVFLRSFLNCYAIDILPNDGYTFNEHAVHGPPDKIFEEAAFLERFRNCLVMEQADSLWIARATPKEWMQQGGTISVRNAPSHFGEVTYEIVSDVDRGRQISATIEIPTRTPPKTVRLRLRHPQGLPIQQLTVNGKSSRDFDNSTGFITINMPISMKGLTGKITVTAHY